MKEAKRRVKVGRQAAEKPIDIDIQAYVDRQIEGLDLEELRQIVIRQEVQMNSVRMILFDMMAVFFSQHARREQALTKARFGMFVRQILGTFEKNVGELRAAHSTVHGPAGVDDLPITVEEGSAVLEAIQNMPLQELQDAAVTPERAAALTERILATIREEAHEYSQTIPDVSDIPTDDYIEESPDPDDIMEQLVAESEEAEAEMEVRRRRATRVSTRRPHRERPGEYRRRRIRD